MRGKPTGLKTRNLGLQFCETDRAFWTQYKVSKNRLGRFFATRWLGIRRDAVARSTKRVNKNWISELNRYDGSDFAKAKRLMEIAVRRFTKVSRMAVKPRLFA